jgi:putative ABC transport system permease protein
MKKNMMVKSSFRIMGSHKLRSFFMMIGMVLGVATLILVFSLGKGTEKKVMTSIERIFNSSNIWVSAGRGKIMSSMQEGPATSLTLDDVATLQREVPNIITCDPMQMILGREIRFDGKSVSATVWGNSETFRRVWNRGVTRGVCFDREAVRSLSRVALVGTNVVRELFGGRDPLGEQILVGNVPFRVLGILEPMGTDIHGSDRDNEIVVPISTLMRRLLNVEYITGVKLIIRDNRQTDATVNNIRAILRERHRLAPAESDDFSILTPVRIREMVAQSGRIFSLFLPLIAAISLLVGGVILANLMLISVNERTEEIGLRKALGARSRDILWQFVMEAGVVALIGGVAGVILGLTGVQLLVLKIKLPFVISWPAISLGVILSAAIGMLAGILPARRAAALDPVKTLR